jgi:hypothetical protein
MQVITYLTNKKFVLDALLLLLGGFYFLAGALAKFGDCWYITNVSMDSPWTLHTSWSTW